MTKKRKWFGLKDLFPYIKKYVPLIVVMCLRCPLIDCR